MNAENKVRTCLWFEKGGEEAARFYVTLLPDSRIESSYRPDPDWPALVLDFTLGGAPYQILNGGPEVSQSPLSNNRCSAPRLPGALKYTETSPSSVGHTIGATGWRDRAINTLRASDRVTSSPPEDPLLRFPHP